MINVVTMEGRLCADSELRTTQGGTSVCSFRIASNDSRKDKDGNYPTVFMNCSLFGKAGEGFAAYAKKGKLVVVVGRIAQRKYVNKSGQEISSTEIICDRAEFGVTDNKQNSNDGAMPPQYTDQGVMKKNNLQNLDLDGEVLPF